MSCGIIGKDKYITRLYSEVSLVDYKRGQFPEVM